MVSRSRKQAGQHDLEKKKWFLGQGSRQASMTQSVLVKLFCNTFG